MAALQTQLEALEDAQVGTGAPFFRYSCLHAMG